MQLHSFHPTNRLLPRGLKSTTQFARLLALILTAGFVAPIFGQNAASTLGGHSNRVHQFYIEAAARWQRETGSAEAGAQFARACFERADFSTNDAQRAALAEQGIAASLRAAELDPRAPDPLFQLGRNLGQLARTKLFTALHLLDEMETAWRKSIALDPRHAYAGAHRSLGLLYLEAPGWPVSLGSRSKARLHLQKAVELAPGYPENHLCWIEAQLKWGENKAARLQLEAVAVLLQSARTNLTGESWSHQWKDWDARWKAIKAKVETAAPSSTRSPRDAR